jgi:hypothetical protein
MLIDGPTIPQLARKLNVPRNTMWRRLVTLHARDRAASLCEFIPWMYRHMGGPWRVNLSRLRRAHPEMFEIASNEELDGRLKRVERQVEVLDSGHRALVVRVRSMLPAG